MHGGDGSRRAAFVVYPGFTGLDLVGPHEILARTPFECSLVGQTRAPVIPDRGLAVIPDLTFAECPAIDLLCVPGGPGQSQAMQNAVLIDFLRERASVASVVVGICTGTLLLAGAGPARGRRASTHWLAREELGRLGAIPVDQRVVRDGNLYTCGGVTSGIDLALRLVGDLFGEDDVKQISLAVEYDPAPPFDVGSPAKASPALVELLRSTSRFHREKGTMR